MIGDIVVLYMVLIDKEVSIDEVLMDVAGAVVHNTVGVAVAVAFGLQLG